MKIFYYPVLLVILLSACGTDTSSNSRSTTDNGNNSHASNDVTYTVTNDPNSADPQPADNRVLSPAQLTLNITDAPLDDVVKVVVTFLSVEFINEAMSQAQTFTFNTPKQIDLLALQGLQFESLLTDVELAAGDYQEMRLVVDDSNMNSFVEKNDGSVHPLKVPSGSSSGLKIKSDFSFIENRANAYTLDFDLKKSVVIAGASGKYNLKPVLRLVENAEVGHIKGEVDAESLISETCSDADVNSYNAVYVYEGLNAIPADLFSGSTLDDQPLTTALIQFDNQTGKYLYVAAYLPAGEYTLAYTCNADQDDPDTDDDVLFFNTENATVQINNILFL